MTQSLTPPRTRPGVLPDTREPPAPRTALEIKAAQETHQADVRPDSEYRRRTQRVAEGAVERIIEGLDDLGKFEPECAMTRGVVRRILTYVRSGLEARRAAAAALVPEPIFADWLAQGTADLGERRWTTPHARLVMLLRAAESESELEATHAVNRRQRNWAAAGWWLSRRFASRWGSDQPDRGGEEQSHLRRTLTIHGDVPSGKRVALPVKEEGVAGSGSRPGSGSARVVAAPSGEGEGAASARAEDREVRSVGGEPSGGEGSLEVGAPGGTGSQAVRGGGDRGRGALVGGSTAVGPDSGSEARMEARGADAGVFVGGVPALGGRGVGAGGSASGVVGSGSSEEGEIASDPGYGSDIEDEA